MGSRVAPPVLQRPGLDNAATVLVVKSRRLGKVLIESWPENLHGELRRPVASAEEGTPALAPKNLLTLAYANVSERRIRPIFCRRTLRNGDKGRGSLRKNLEQCGKRG